MEELSTLCCQSSSIMGPNHTVPMWKELYLQIIKSVHRYRMNIENENNKLFIHYDMPDLEN